MPRIRGSDGFGRREGDEEGGKERRRFSSIQIDSDVASAASRKGEGKKRRKGHWPESATHNSSSPVRPAVAAAANAIVASKSNKCWLLATRGANCEGISDRPESDFGGWKNRVPISSSSFQWPPSLLAFAFAASATRYVRRARPPKEAMTS
jgi:hypothetical protein